MSRNIVQTNEIRRFEKSDKKKQKKSDFQTSELRSRSKKWRVSSIGITKPCPKECSWSTQLQLPKQNLDKLLNKALQTSYFLITITIPYTYRQAKKALEFRWCNFPR